MKIVVCVKVTPDSSEAVEVVDGQVSLEGICPGAIDNPGVLDQNLIHVVDSRWG